MWEGKKTLNQQKVRMAKERPHAIGVVCIISGLGLPVGQSLAGFAGSASGWVLQHVFDIFIMFLVVYFLF